MSIQRFLNKFINKLKTNKVRDLILKCYCISTLAFFLGSWVQTPSLASFHNSTLQQPFHTPAVTIEVKLYDSEESKKLLEKDLIALGLQPIQITITNNSEHSYSICPSSFDLKTLKTREVIKKAYRSDIPRRIGYSIAGFFFWPFSIPSAIDGMVTHKLKKSYRQRLDSKAIKKEVIAPYATVTRVLFVKKEDLKENFDVTLIDLETLKPLIHKQHITLEQK